MDSHKPKTRPPLADILTDPRLALMLALGFSSGLPFLLIFSTQSAWLREVGISRTEIGLMSYVALAFTFKFPWAPLIDRYDAPLLARLLGRRRAWMLLAQLARRGRSLRPCLRRPRSAPRLDDRLRVPHRLRGGDAGRGHRRLAHRCGAGRAAGRDVCGLSARISPGAALRRGRRALHCRFRELAQRLSGDGGTDAGGHRRLPARARVRSPTGRGPRPSLPAASRPRSAPRSSSRSPISCAAMAG